MPIVARLLLVLTIAAAAVTALVGLTLRGVAGREVLRALEQRIEIAGGAARAELAEDARDLAKRVATACAPGGGIDRLLADLGKNRRPDAAWRDNAERHLVALSPALDADEVQLAWRDGTVEVSVPKRGDRRRDARLAERLRSEPGSVRASPGGDALEVHCLLVRDGDAIGLLASKALAPLVEHAGTAHAVSLAVGGVAPASGLTRQFSVPEVTGLEMTATLSLAPLDDALAEVDRALLLTGGMSLLLAIALGVLVARTIVGPISALARQTHRALREERPVTLRGGGRELRDLVAALNKAIAELGSVRRKLARVERIAAQREIARQIAHEIKNPLAPIRTAIETLRRLRRREDPQFDGYFEEATEVVLGEVRRISDIVRQFTQFARMPAPVFAKVDLAAAARSVVALHDAGKAPVTTVPSDALLPRRAKPRVELDAEPGAEVIADRDQIVQVLTNLVQNGLEAASAERLDPRVCIAIRRDSESAVAVYVADNGPGVPADLQPKLFELYTTAKPGGTGLGLAIVQRIVHEHGGEIECLATAARDVATAPPGGGRTAVGTGREVPTRARELGGAVFRVVLPVDGPPQLEPGAVGDRAADELRRAKIDSSPEGSRSLGG